MAADDELEESGTVIEVSDRTKDDQSWYSSSKNMRLKRFSTQKASV